MDKSHVGACFCGAVTVEVTGVPLEMGYCHCSSCRAHSGAPVSAYVLWKQDDVKIMKGAEFVGRYGKTEMSDRHFCKKCGGHVLVTHPFAWSDARLPCQFPHTDIQTDSAPELRGNGAADEGRASQVEGFSSRSRRLR